MSSHAVIQDHRRYTDSDHETWRLLCRRQDQIGIQQVSRAYLEAYQKLQLDRQHIVNIEAMSHHLYQIAGWKLMPVTGLIPTRDFFYLIVNKIYPVTISIRRPHEIDFSEQPDIFHDVCGHLPLLTNRKFSQFLSAYSAIALKYADNDKAVECLGRLYWYTYEMGMINESGQLRAYGGALITSSQERDNARNPRVPKYPFFLDRIFRTPYNPYKLQLEYFVINSFDDLFDITIKLEEELLSYLNTHEKTHAGIGALEQKMQ